MELQFLILLVFTTSSLLPDGGFSGNIPNTTRLEGTNSSQNPAGQRQGDDGGTSLQQARASWEAKLVQLLKQETRTTLQDDGLLGHVDLNTLKAMESALQSTRRLVQDSIRSHRRAPPVGIVSSSSSPSNWAALIDAIEMDNLEDVGRSMRCGSSFANQADSQGYALIHHAASWNSSTVLKYLVEEAGANVDVKSGDPELDTPLHIAVRGNYKGMVHYLVEQGADVNARNGLGLTPLHLAVEGSATVAAAEQGGGRGRQTLSRVSRDTFHKVVAKCDRLNIAQYLIHVGADVNARANDGMTPLHVAASHCELRVVEYLVEQGADPDAVNEQGFKPSESSAEPSVHDYLQQREKEVVQSSNGTSTGGNVGPSMEYYRKNLTLLEAVLMGDLEAVRVRVDEAGDNILSSTEEMNGNAAIHLASADARLSILQYLVEEARVPVDILNDGGYTPLHLAVRYSQVEAMKYLTSKGANVSSTNALIGGSMLHDAALRKNLDVLKYLVDHGADLNAKDSFGTSVLSYAASTNHLSTVTFLVDEGGADVNGRDQAGRTPLHFACDGVEPEGKGKMDGLKYIFQNGVDVDGGVAATRRTWPTSPYYEAPWQGFRTIEYLIRNGAELDAMDNNGDLPFNLMAANMYKFPGVIGGGGAYRAPTPTTLPPNSTSPNQNFLSFCSGEEEKPQDKSADATTSMMASITIAVLGRRGFGISSTVSDLIGPCSTCRLPETNATRDKIVEYILTSIPGAPAGASYSVKLVDVPGLVDGRTLEADASILASLKGYMATEEFPRLFLAISGFDDNRMDGDHSLFVQFLRKMELVQSMIFGNRPRSNTAFLLTRFLSETKRLQRRPKSKLQDFSSVIQRYTRFPAPIQLVVGDNRAGSDYEIELDSSGYYPLPNGDQYPKTVWTALLNLLNTMRTNGTTAEVDPSEVATEIDILTSLMNNRGANISCSANVFTPVAEPFEEDVHDFKYLFKRGATSPAVQIQNNEVNMRLNQLLFLSGKLDRVVQKVALQTRLQDSNITQIGDLPRGPNEQALFFQKHKIHKYAALMLNDAFGLKMPPYGSAHLVGHGFYIMKDELTLSTPFRTDRESPSDVGFKLPNFIHCRPLAEPEVVVYNSYAPNLRDFYQELLQHYDFPPHSTGSLLNLTAVQARLKDGFNLAPEEHDRSTSLSVVKEVRTVECYLRRSDCVTSDDFLAAVESLPTLDVHDRDSVREWNGFFSQFGSHVIIKAYGGGRLKGRVTGEPVLCLVRDDGIRNQTLQAILEFGELPPPAQDESVMYTFSGGRLDGQGVNFTGMEASARNGILEAWESELKTGFVMLNYEMGLSPISSFVVIDANKQRDMEEGIRLLLGGELSYRRKQRPKNNNNNSIVVTSSRTLSGSSGSGNLYHSPLSSTTTTPIPYGGSAGASPPPTSTSSYLSLCAGDVKPAYQPICAQLKSTQETMRRLEQVVQNQTAQSALLHKQQQQLLDQYRGNLTSDLIQAVHNQERDDGAAHQGHYNTGAGGYYNNYLEDFARTLQEDKEERERKMREQE